VGVCGILPEKKTNPPLPLLDQWGRGGGRKERVEAERTQRFFFGRLVNQGKRGGERHSYLCMI